MARAMKKRSKSGKPTNAMAFQGTASNGRTHVVGIGNLRVTIVKDGKYWTAQGLEIDYIAQGASVEDVKSQFEDGLAATIQQHLCIYGDIRKLLVPAPTEIWQDTLDPETIHRRYSQLTIHQVIREATPFTGIDYLELASAA